MSFGTDDTVGIGAGYQQWHVVEPIAQSMNGEEPLTLNIGVCRPGRDPEPLHSDHGPRHANLPCWQASVTHTAHSRGRPLLPLK